MVIGTGPLNASIALVGEAPGAQEDAEGVPFVGDAGKELNRVLDLVGIDRSRLYITNVVLVRPPGNSTPRLWEIAYGRKRLRTELGIVEPDLVILAGATAYSSAFPGSLSQAVGKIRHTDTRAYLPVWHPAACLRSSIRQSENEQYFRLAQPYDV